MHIGFYGDSFCSEKYNYHSKFHKYKTYIQMLEESLDADIVNLGIGGSSYYDLILHQFVKPYPDICIFTWTDPNRLYHPTIRNLTPGSFGFFARLDEGSFFSPVYKAAKMYYKHLHSDDKAKLECSALLEYFDNRILKDVDSKIIHLWCFEKTYDFKNGTTVDIILNEHATPHNNGANHFGDQNSNRIIFEAISKCL